MPMCMHVFRQLRSCFRPGADFEDTPGPPRPNISGRTGSHKHEREQPSRASNHPRGPSLAASEDGIGDHQDVLAVEGEASIEETASKEENTGGNTCSQATSRYHDDDHEQQARSTPSGEASMSSRLSGMTHPNFRIRTTLVPNEEIELDPAAGTEADIGRDCAEQQHSRASEEFAPQGDGPVNGRLIAEDGHTGEEQVEKEAAAAAAAKGQWAHDLSINKKSAAGGHGGRITYWAKIAGKTALDAVVAGSDAFPPLKSVVSGIQFIVDHAEQASVNQEDLKALSEHVKRIGDLVKIPLDEAEQHSEQPHRQYLENELCAIDRTLDPLRTRGKLAGVVAASEDKALLQGYITRVDQALSQYLVSTVQYFNENQAEHDELNILDKLPRAKKARYDASNDRSCCLQGTREEVLHTIQKWASNPASRQIYWLNGHAGSGKSTIAQSFAESLSDKRLGASFFCSRDSADRSDLTKIFPTVAYQLAIADNPASPRFRKCLLGTMKSNIDIGHLSLHNQLEDLIIEPSTKSLMETVIVIDALDECKDKETTSAILTVLSNAVARIPSIKFFITGRPESHIRSGFRHLDSMTEVMVLHEVDEALVHEDIKLFVSTKLKAVAAARSDISLPDEWPKVQDVDALTTKSARLFIFAATAVKLVETSNDPPVETLQHLLDDSTAQSTITDLDTLYRSIFNQAFAAATEAFLSKLRSVLGLLTLAYDLLSRDTIAEILLMRASEVKNCLRSLHSVVLVPDQSTLPLRFFHKSCPDFLADSERCTDSRFQINLDHCHARIAEHCFRVMRAKLKKNICNVPRYSFNDDLNSENRDKFISEATKYCCRYWSNHLLSDKARDEHLSSTAPLLEYFVTVQQLWYFEVVGLLKELWRAVESLNAVREWLMTRDETCTDLQKWISDGHRFILDAFDHVQLSVSHIYHSFLPFASRESVFRTKGYSTNWSDEANIIIGAEQHWMSNFQFRTIEIPGQAYSITYSHEGTVFAVGGGNLAPKTGFSQLFRSGTGERVAQLDSKCDHVCALAFSLDDQTIATAAGSDIRLWDVFTGALRGSYDRYQQDLGIVRSIEFHPSIDHLLLAADEGGNILLWDTLSTSGCDNAGQLQELDIPNSSGVVCWFNWPRAPERKLFLLGTNSGCIEIWSAVPWKRINNLTTVDYLDDCPAATPVQALALSKDGSRIACSSLHGITIYSLEVGPGDTAASRIQVVAGPRHFMSPSAYVSSMHFCSTEYGLALGFAGDNILRMCLLSDDDRIIPFLGHSGSIEAVAFSPSGRFIASASIDETVQIWETHDEYLRPYYNRVKSAHFSFDGELIVSVWEDFSLRVHRARDGTVLIVLKEDALPTGARRPIDCTFLLHEGHVVITCDPTEHPGPVLWNWQEEWVLHQPSEVYHIIDDKERHVQVQLESRFPSSVVSMGVFSTQLDPSSRWRICFWKIVRDNPNHVHYLKVAEGRLPVNDAKSGGVVQVNDRRCSNTSDCTVIVECTSGKRYVAIMAGANSGDSTSTPPETLLFGSEDGYQNGQASFRMSYGQSYMWSEEPSQQTRHESWVRDRNGQGIMWIPKVYRGRGRWLGSKLLLEGERLCLIDFSQCPTGDEDCTSCN